MNVIFSGGPANGQRLEIPDGLPEWRFPVAPPITWNGIYSSDTANIKVARYVRTQMIEDDGSEIYEFIGIA